MLSSLDHNAFSSCWANLSLLSMSPLCCDGFDSNGLFICHRIHQRSSNVMFANTLNTSISAFHHGQSHKKLAMTPSSTFSVPM